MGWTTSNRWTRKSLIQERIQREVTQHSGTIRECLAHCYKGAPWKGTLWTVWKLTKVDGTVIKYIGCDLLQYYKNDGGCWGYKDLEASMGVNQTNCPLSYLLMETYDYDYDKGYFIEWVGRVLTDYKKKDSNLYKKTLKAFPNAIPAYIEAKAKADAEGPFIPKKMVNFSEIVPIDLLVAMDKAYDQEIIEIMNSIPLTNPE